MASPTAKRQLSPEVPSSADGHAEDSLPQLPAIKKLRGQGLTSVPVRETQPETSASLVDSGATAPAEPRKDRVVKSLPKPRSGAPARPLENPVPGTPAYEELSRELQIFILGEATVASLGIRDVEDALGEEDLGKLARTCGLPGWENFDAYGEGEDGGNEYGESAEHGEQHSAGSSRSPRSDTEASGPSDQDPRKAVSDDEVCGEGEFEGSQDEKAATATIPNLYTAPAGHGYTTIVHSSSPLANHSPALSRAIGGPSLAERTSNPSAAPVEVPARLPRLDALNPGSSSMALRMGLLRVLGNQGFYPEDDAMDYEEMSDDDLDDSMNNEEMLNDNLDDSMDNQEMPDHDLEASQNAPVERQPSMQVEVRTCDRMDENKGDQMNGSLVDSDPQSVQCRATDGDQEMLEQSALSGVDGSATLTGIVNSNGREEKIETYRESPFRVQSLWDVSDDDESDEDKPYEDELNEDEPLIEDESLPILSLCLSLGLLVLDEPTEGAVTENIPSLSSKRAESCDENNNGTWIPLPAIGSTSTTTLGNNETQQSLIALVQKSENSESSSISPETTAIPKSRRPAGLEAEMAALKESVAEERREAARVREREVTEFNGRVRQSHLREEAHLEAQRKLERANRALRQKEIGLKSKVSRMEEEVYTLRSDSCAHDLQLQTSIATVHTQMQTIGEQLKTIKDAEKQQTAIQRRLETLKEQHKADVKQNDLQMQTVAEKRLELDNAQRKIEEVSMKWSMEKEKPKKAAQKLKGLRKARKRTNEIIGGLVEDKAALKREIVNIETAQTFKANERLNEDINNLREEAAILQRQNAELERSLKPHPTRVALQKAHDDDPEGFHSLSIERLSRARSRLESIEGIPRHRRARSKVHFAEAVMESDEEDDTESQEFLDALTGLSEAVPVVPENASWGLSNSKNLPPFLRTLITLILLTLLVALVAFGCSVVEEGILWLGGDDPHTMSVVSLRPGGGSGANVPAWLWNTPNLQSSGGVWG